MNLPRFDGHLHPKKLLISLFGGYFGSLLLFSIVFLLCFQNVISGHGVAQWDAFDIYLPAQSIVADHARDGSFLQWNPFIGGGRPDGADPQVGAFSPLNVILGALVGGSPSGVVVYWLFVWWLGGLGIVLLARHLGAPPWAACLGALAFSFSGFQIGHATHISVLYGVSFLPIIVWRLDCALSSERWLLPAAEAGALWGICALGGYPAITILNGCFLACWVAGRLLQRRAVGGVQTETKYGVHGISSSWSRQIIRAGVVMAVLMAIGIVVMVPAYLGFFLEFKGYDHRVEPISREVAIRSNALDPLALPTFASPYLGLLNFMNRDRLKYTSPTCANIYVSIPALVLAIAGLFFVPGGMNERIWRWWLFLVGAMFLMTALAVVFPFRGWLYDLASPFRYFRHATKFRAYYVFCLIVLALEFCRDIDRLDVRSWVRNGWLRVVFVSVFLGIGGLASFFSFHALPRLGPHFGPALTLSGGLFLVMALAGALGFQFPGFATTRGIGILLLGFVVVDVFATMIFSERMVYSTIPEHVATWDKLVEKYDPSLDLGNSENAGSCFDRRRKSSFSNNYNNANIFTKQQVLVSYGAFFSQPVRIWFHNDVLIDAAACRKRVWFSEDAAKIGYSKESMFRFLKRSRALGSPPMVFSDLDDPSDVVPARGGNPEEIRVLNGLEAMSPVTVELEEYRPNTLRFWLDVPSDGWLMVTDRYAPGWRAWIDGEESEILCAGLIFRGLKVTHGRHLIDFEFRQWGHPWLAIISWLTWISVGVLSLFAWITSRHSVNVCSVVRSTAKEIG